ncbi:MAG: PSD1 and planctomycete cytochrome C domain-containing protein [Acidobacteriota bacterium]
MRLWMMMMCAASLGAQVNFQAEVRPILAKRCWACHGPDENGRQAGVRLDVREAAVKNNLLVPGDSAKSRIVERVTHPTRPMPPSGTRLTEAEVDALKRWIDSGAKYEEHWAYRKPERRNLPAVKDEAWGRNAIDAFVLAKLEEKGLRPSGPADAATLARRVALDLTGMPPEAAVLEPYLRSPGAEAYEKYVDALLASPRFGERWAKVWLDLARYADTQGYEKDNRRVIWPYRDWVIRAFNENLPFDQFTVQQIAGDLLAEGTVEDLVATGFHRNTMTNTEGGTDDEEFRDLAVRDRVATTGQVWMGQTWGCAQCHTHKYDPLSHKEFYQLYAFLNQTEDNDHASDRPLLRLNKEVSTLVMRELAAGKQRKTRIFERGNFLTPGEEVEAGTPAFLPGLDKDAPRNRLGFAQWLVSRENPLTARVTVNRYWSRLMGRGIVETEEDFGTQGALPTHPELLDWLAVEFEQKWDTKGLLRLIVTSATYQQASAVTPDLLARDPQNQWYARGARFRLDAEVVRDQALAAAGLLSTKMYGPPVMPWQPEGVWQVVYNGDAWRTSQGEDRYRRAIYTFMRRTSSYPAMMNFDAPTGETCTVRRIRTNTPLQALTTLNDPVFMEAAQKLAAGAMTESPRDPGRAIFRRVLLREPNKLEQQRLALLYRQAEAELRAKPGNAQKLARFDEVLYKEDRPVTLLPDARTKPREWRYQTAEPVAGWEKADFDDTPWKAGPGYFGYFEKPDSAAALATPARTRWDTESIYLRIAVDLPEKMPSGFQMPIRTNCSHEIWVNGVPALTNVVYERAGHYEYELTAEGQKAFRPGRNVIAVKATRNNGTNVGQVFDAGLVAVAPLELGKPVRPDVVRAAWAVVANTVLNLDESLMRR